MGGAPPLAALYEHHAHRIGPRLPKRPLVPLWGVCRRRRIHPSKAGRLPSNAGTGYVCTPFWIGYGLNSTVSGANAATKPPIVSTKMGRRRLVFDGLGYRDSSAHSRLFGRAAEPRAVAGPPVWHPAPILPDAMPPKRRPKHPLRGRNQACLSARCRGAVCAGLRRPLAGYAAPLCPWV